MMSHRPHRAIALRLALAITLGLLATSSQAGERQLLVPLDSVNAYGVRLNYDAAKGQVIATLTTRAPGLSPTTSARLSQALSVTVNGQPMQVKPGSGLASFTFKGALAGGTQVDIKISGETVRSLVLDRTAGRFRAKPAARQLSSFELRAFAYPGGQRFLDKWARRGDREAAAQQYSPRIDIHTHFGSAMRAESMMRVAVRNKMTYPTSLLEQLKIPYKTDAVVKIDGKLQPVLVQSGTRTQVRICKEALGKSGLKRLEAKLRINPTEVVPFGSMEDAFKYRNPLTKDPRVFGEYLRILARDYQKSGVKFAALSVADIVKPEWLQVAHDVLPQVEKDTGVKIRFLVGLWRHNPSGYNDDMLANIKAMGPSPYIIGADFMGHETNSSKAFTETIKALATYREKYDSSFQIRVHAGENPLHPENVREAIKAGATHIGHGLYGVTDDVLELAKQNDVTFEFNMGSNLTLNNIKDITKVPIRRYLAKGCRVTLGTDGHGLYSTSGKGELGVALHVGLTQEELRQIRASDDKYIADMDAGFTRKMAQPHALVVRKALPPGKFTDADWAKWEQTRTDNVNRLKSELQTRKVTEVSDPNLLFPGKVPVLMIGASESSWPKISPKNRRLAGKAVRSALRKIDPKKAYVVTGGTDEGIEKIVHEEAKKLDLPVFSFVAGATHANIGTVSHAKVMNGGNGKWYDLTADMLGFVKEKKGLAFFIGGGGMINDAVLAAHTVKLPFYLMKEPEGAAQDSIGRFPEHVVSGVSGIAKVLEADPRKLTKPSSTKISNWRIAPLVKDSWAPPKSVVPRSRQVR